MVTTCRRGVDDKVRGEQVDDELNGSESGGQLRAKLEEALAANKAMSTELFGLKASQVIGAKGLKYVTPEDLSGVGLNELEAKALELEGQKAEQRQAVVKSVLEEKGLAGDQLETALKQLLTPAEAAAEAAHDRVASLGRLQGTAPGSVDERNLYGVDKIRHALNNPKT
jgi:hypothetical protein